MSESEFLAKKLPAKLQEALFNRIAWARQCYRADYAKHIEARKSGQARTVKQLERALLLHRRRMDPAYGLDDLTARVSLELRLTFRKLAAQQSAAEKTAGAH